MIYNYNDIFNNIDILNQYKSFDYIYLYCDVCSKPFRRQKCSILRSIKKGKNKTHCSEACIAITMHINNQITVTCTNCNANITKRKSQLNEINNFCSHVCAALYNNGKRGEYRNPLVELTCNKCDKIFTRKRKQLSITGNNFCSKRCSSIGNIPKNKLTKEQYLIENCPHSRGNLKRMLIRDNIIPYICEMCDFDPLTTQWNNKQLILRLDHKNGISNDCRIDNLRFLCPNCDSQTETYCGRNKAYKNK